MQSLEIYFHMDGYVVNRDLDSMDIRTVLM
jgi:hypothetical protein